MATVSIIVPVYNVESFLCRCIDSILCQSFSDFDLILVDDGSPDNCGTICDNYAAKDSRIHVIHQENKGLSAARNVAIDWIFANSDSQWLTFIDSDDWIHPDYLKLLLDAANSQAVKISNIDSFDTDGTYPLPERTYSPYRLCTPSEIMNARGGVCAQRKLYARELFSTIRFPLNRLHEDEFTTPFVLFTQDKIAQIDERMYYYYVRPNSIMRSNWSPRNLDAVYAKENQLAFFRKNGHSEQFIITYNQYIRILSTQYHQVHTNNPPNKYRLSFSLRKKARTAIRHHSPAPKPTIRTEPHLFEVAYPVFMNFYWTFSALWHKFFPR